MTDPTDDIPPEPRQWRLVLDEGETLEVRPADRPDEPGPAAVVLFMSANRAADLSEVLGAYSRVSEIMHDVTQVSVTEESLQRGLMDAARAVKGTLHAARTPTTISDGAKLAAMDVLQAARPELTHSAVVAIIDAAAWWLADDKDHRAMDLLTAVQADVGMSVYFTLLDRPTPPSLAPRADTHA
jgi:hypothetical protein